MCRARRNFILGASLIVASLAAVADGLHARAVTITDSTPVTAQGSNDIALQAGPAALFRTYCALCHEGPGADAQAPSLEVMRRLSAEQVLESLERGSMRARAAERSRAQRRALAAYVSGKPLAADSSGSMPKSAFCSAGAVRQADRPARTGLSRRAATRPAPSPAPLAGPAWNGWGQGITNARFQSADAAGMVADDVPRLTLKWAFGFPGASSAGTQPVVAGGRVYVATAEGEMYVLDAKTGCLHWTLEVEAAVRSAMTLDERGNGELVAYFGDQTANVYAACLRSDTPISLPNPSGPDTTGSNTSGDSLRP